MVRCAAYAETHEATTTSMANSKANTSANQIEMVVAATAKQLSAVTSQDNHDTDAQ